MTTSFGVRKFRALLLAGSFTVLVNYVLRLTDAVVAGNLIGTDALAGVNLAAPFLSAISFLSGLIATGMATNYSLAMGRLDRTRAHRFFVQALWSVAIFQGALSLFVLFGRNWFLGFLGAEASVSAHAADYLRWLWPFGFFDGLLALMASVCYVDGDTKLCSASYAVLFVANVVLSVLGVKLGMGAGGCAFGSLLASVLATAVLAFHFLRKTNSFRLVRHFSLADSWRIAAASFGDAAAFLCDALLFLFLSKFAIARFGSETLPVVSVATVLWGFLQLFNGIGVAVQPIVTVYYGEGNTRAVRSVMRAAIVAAVAEGVFFMALFGAFPWLVLRMVGVTDPELVRQGCLAVRLVCGGFVALALAGLFNSYYMFVERSLLAGVVTFACYLAMPVASVAACSLGGVEGMWAGLGLGPVAGCVLASLFIVATCGWRRYPLMLDRSREAQQFDFDLELSDESIVTVSRQVAGVLSQRNVPEAKIMRASLMTEEVLMAVKDRNCGRRTVGEVVLDLTDGITLTLRDDGEIFDITDADAQISSLRTFLVASVMERQVGRLNLVTTGFNRNVFRF